MQNRQSLTGARWRKSSYSGGTGGECIECAPLGTAVWAKSSYSGDTGGDCVEVADVAPHIAVRDSKNPSAGVVTFSPAAFSAFVRGTSGKPRG
ncbi:DUF397 domain-containing protein [Streptomyces griseorubiginosus]|uniref:DUF397 domain-containing protein n=1 Tax=Streptomyces griseorubiginosus TaxID=67304 RepID=UPI001AD69125|nr:DUF397 domain-containing protein [Streptomyces griseorubiginosus]MBO4259272.1 DUF397 domain-containing protein [Streptomyces griseorubiginosus]